MRTNHHRRHVKEREQGNNFPSPHYNLGIHPGRKAAIHTFMAVTGLGKWVLGAILLFLVAIEGASCWAWGHSSS